MFSGEGTNGDGASPSAARKMRERAMLCPSHGLFAPDPDGWGTGCPKCELDIWCVTGKCGKQTCHRCYPAFECEYGHQSCFQMEDEMYRHGGFERNLYEDYEDEEYPYDYTTTHVDDDFYDPGYNSYREYLEEKAWEEWRNDPEAQHPYYEPPGYFD